MIVSKEDAVGSIQGAVSKERMQLGRLQRGCQRHRTKVASHTAVPLGTAKWLVWDCPNNNSLPLGRRHEQPLSLTYGKVLGVGVALTSHFETPKGVSVWLATFV